MSARTDLTAHLRATLPTKYRVLDDPPGSDAKINTGRAAVHVQRAGITPNGGSWGHALAVYVLVGPEGFTTAENALDDLLPAVVTAVEAMQNNAVTGIDRDVFFNDGDAGGFHGYRITTATLTTSI